MKHEYFDCQCTTAEHTLRIDVFEQTTIDPDGEIYIQFQLNRNNSFWKRVWVALRYVFGYTCRYGHWDEMIVRLEDYQRLVDIFSKKKMTTIVNNCVVYNNQKENNND